MDQFQQRERREEKLVGGKKESQSKDRRKSEDWHLDKKESMDVKWKLRQNHLGKPLLWATFSVIHFSAMQQGRWRIENSDFHGGFFPPTPSSLLLCLASACQTLFPQLSFIPIFTWPVTTPDASLLTNSMSWCSHTCSTPIWCWVKRLLNFGSDDPGKEWNTFRTQMHLLCAFAYPQSQLSEPEGLSSGCSRVASFALSWFYCFSSPALRESSYFYSVIFIPNLGVHCIRMVFSEQAKIFCVLTAALSFMVWSVSIITLQSAANRDTAEFTNGVALILLSTWKIPFWLTKCFIRWKACPKPLPFINEVKAKGVSREWWWDIDNQDKKVHQTGQKLVFIRWWMNTAWELKKTSQSL